jgi:acyl-CoA thioesterase FadM
MAVAFDEVLSRVALVQRGSEWVTAELTVRLQRPVSIGACLTFRSRIRSERSRLIVTEAEAYLPDGTVVGRAESKLMKAPR